MDILKSIFQFVVQNSSKIINIIGIVLSMVQFLLKTRNKKMAENPSVTLKSVLPTLIKNLLLWVLKRFDVWVILRELNSNWKDKAILTKTPADDWACDAVDVIIEYLSGENDKPKIEKFK